MLAARREEIVNGYVLKVCLRDCSGARMQRCGHEIVRPDLSGHRQVCGSDTQENSVEVVRKRIQNEEGR